MLFFSVPLILFFFGAELLLDDSLLTGSSKIYKKVYEYLKNTDDVRILVFGNSHGDNAISDDFRPYVFNLSNQGQDLKYDWFLFDFIGDIEKLDCVVLTLSFFSFEYSEDKIWPYRVKDYMDLHSLKPTRNILHFKNWLYDNSDIINHNMSTNHLVNYIKNTFFQKTEQNKKEKYENINSHKKRVTLIFDAKKKGSSESVKIFQFFNKYQSGVYYKIYKKMPAERKVPGYYGSPFSLDSYRSL